MSKEFIEAAKAFAKRSRRVALGIEIFQPSSGGYWQGSAQQYSGRFVPRWLLIEAVDGMIIEDVLFGNQSQFAGHGPVPAELYSIADATKLFESPDSPAWDRFKFENHDREPLDPHQGISVRVSFQDGIKPTMGPVHCVFLGDEPSFKNWEVETRGTLVGVSVTGAGPMVEVVLGDVDYSMRQPGLQQAPVRIPIKPSDIPLLVDKIGKRIRFKLQTEE